MNIEKSKLPDGLNGVASITEITVQRPLRWLFCALEENTDRIQIKVLPAFSFFFL